jgi:tetratricopeptide (TPR) repeat protein
VIGLVQVGVQSYADRYTYIPLIGLFILLAWGLPDLVGAWRFRSPVLGVAAVLALACCSALTWRQVGYWKDSETLFERTLAVTSDNYVVHSNLGGTLLRENRLDEAIRHLEEARRIRPDHVAAISNLGVAVQGKGRFGEAIELYREALRLKPTHVEAWLNLGHALEMTGDLDGALAAFREAKRQMPDEPSIGTRIQAILARQERPDARASYDRGNRLRDGGRLEDAATAYREAIGIDPSFADAHNNLGSVLGRQGRTEEAIAEFEKALEIAPNLSAAHNNLAIALAIRGDTARAATHLAEVLRLDPRDAVAHYNLGLLLAKQGKTAEAIAHYEEALRIQPGYESAARAIEQARRR